MTSAIGVTLAVVVIGVPALAFAVWPLLRRRSGAAGALLPLPADPREQLAEDRRAALRALRELEFEHTAGHVSDEDYADLRARYEAETATILSELDRLGAAPAPAPAAVAPPAAARRAGWRHPAAITVGGVALVTFGVVLGVGIVRYTEPDPNAGAPMAGSRPMAALDAPSAANAPKGPVTPAMLQGMLQAARSSLFAGRYSEAMAAYQAVLKRDASNVDAMTHMGLIAAIAAQSEHGPEMVNRALDLFQRALALDPNYAPALLYRGQVLYEVKKDVPGAIESWEKFVAVTPPGEDRDRVAKLLADARAQSAPKR